MFFTEATTGEEHQDNNNNNNTNHNSSSSNNIKLWHIANACAIVMLISCQVGEDWLVGDKTNRFKLRHTQAHLIASQLQGLSDPLNHLQAEFSEQSS